VSTAESMGRYEPRRFGLGEEDGMAAFDAFMFRQQQAVADAAEANPGDADIELLISAQFDAVADALIVELGDGARHVAQVLDKLGREHAGDERGVQVAQLSKVIYSRLEQER
jgi:hypothetical protein